MDSRAFQKATGVSRETLERLEIYDRLLKKWQKAINLVGPRTVAQSWERHFLDSAQIYGMAPEGVRTGVWLDMGAGAGFPGLVIALLGARHVHLVESDLRKATFQREVIRATGAPATVHAVRMETLAPFPVDVITARAFAPLEKLLGMAYPFWGDGVVGLFPKGRDVELELTQAAKCWKVDVELLGSRSDESARILRIAALSRTDRQ
jgi:16S rRNA (guanine527-N7)-methyltransferase